MKKQYYLISFLLLAAIFISGCRDANATEEKVESKLEKATEKVEKAAEKVEEAGKIAKEEVKGAVADIKEELNGKTDDN